MKVSILNLFDLAFKHFSYWLLENETFEKKFGKSAEEEGVQKVLKIEEKIRYLRRHAFVDDPLISVFKASKKKPHHKWKILPLIILKMRTCIPVLVVLPDTIAFHITSWQRMSHFVCLF